MAEASGPNTYTLQVVKEHNKSDDLWIVIDGKVYDVTKFRHEHPGGEDALDEVAGRDATTEFNDVGHSQEAKEMLKKYYIGDLAGGSVIAKASVSTPPPPTEQATTPPPPTETPATDATINDGEKVVPPQKQCCILA
ncbi:cytochrome b5 isoform X1 [Eurosta solidaginis]|uniref:cytochrome b5 isoform X1 n=1 Tax=Eurosta solidaginis TaxID=178769 RepID=UPI003530B394